MMVRCAVQYDEEEARKDPLGYEFALLPRQKGTKAVILQAAPAKVGVRAGIVAACNSLGYRRTDR